MRLSRFTAGEDRYVVISLPLEEDALDDLTDAERSIVELVIAGLSNADIAKARAVSERTVANQMAAVLKKTGTRSRYELIVKLQR
jgi:DNA-binding NarL/FixJ family response regulator